MTNDLRKNEKIQQDRALIESCIKNNPVAQERLFKKYYGLMFGICLRYADKRLDAKEILQEGYIKIFANIKQFKFEGSLSGWMKTIMVNTAIDKYRKMVLEPTMIDADDSVEVKVQEDIFSVLEKKDILDCINKLPVGYRTILNLYAIEGYTHKEIAEKLGVSEGTSKSQLFKAKEYLKQHIDKIYSYYNG